MDYLYDTIIREFGKRGLHDTIVPTTIIDNLRPSYSPRSYQLEAFKRFILCYTEDFKGKPAKPLHLLFNMATGSGKTLIMAGLMLYLYEKGYRNFLFFVNSNTIIKKTKDNFLNPQASKYLFSDKLIIDSRAVHIREVENFDEADTENINIKFTTIQQLHSDLHNAKENSITLEDFEDKKVVLIADEAHHFNKTTKEQRDAEQLHLKEKPSWENTVATIAQAHYDNDNILLEFTATLDYDSQAVAQKYQSRVIYKYGLAQFREDKYSKEINLIRSDYAENERIIQALVINLYRQELAAAHTINLKPVILFKAKHTIEESEQNKVRFHKLVEDLSAEMIENIQKSIVPIVKKAFQFFASRGMSNAEIAKRIQANFKEENCISANSDTEAEINQILLNTLEEDNNPIRAVFAVQKLNEGWDVLNLFDIVRLYETRDAKSGRSGKTTISEAQLIGRGARYFPFTLDAGQDPFTRKFDDDADNNLKILEELYYHTIEDSRYISELKKALVQTGIYEDDANTIQLSLELKPEFKESSFYQTGEVAFNKRVPKNYDNIRSFADLGVKKKNIRYTLASGVGRVSSAFFELEAEPSIEEEAKQKDISLNDIPPHIIRFALSQNPFYYFDSLLRYFPNIPSLSHFIESDNYLNGLAITFNGIQSRLDDISNKDYLSAIHKLLAAMETDIKSHLTEYEGSEYQPHAICEVFIDKDILVDKDSERAKGQEELIKEKPWYAYNANYGTSEEKAFVEMFARGVQDLQEKFTDIYLIRNERIVKIFDKLGRAFEPDFLLFCKRDNKKLNYQVFIEPKGEHLIAHDKWKEDFLNELRKDKKTIAIHNGKCCITGVPFYHNTKENEFKERLNEVLQDRM